MGCCTSNLKQMLEKQQQKSDAGNMSMDSVYLASTPTSSKQRRNGGSKRSYSSRRSSSSTRNNSSSGGSNSSGLGSACSTPSRSGGSSSSSRSIWSRTATPRPSHMMQRSICDDFAEQQQEDRSCGYYTCSSAASTPTKSSVCLRRTQDMSLGSNTSHTSSNRSSGSYELDNAPAVSDLEWEMYMMTHAQRLMPKTSSPLCQRRDATFEVLPTPMPTPAFQSQPTKSYHKWRNYLQSTPAHMLHNVTHIPEAIAGHFCPTDFPAFSDLEDMDSAAKRFKVDNGTMSQQLCTTSQLLAGYTHTITTDL